MSEKGNIVWSSDQGDLRKRERESFMFYPLLSQHHHHRGADNEDCKIKACPPDQWNNPRAQNEDREILIRWETFVEPLNSVILIGDDQP